MRSCAPEWPARRTSVAALSSADLRCARREGQGRQSRGAAREQALALGGPGVSLDSPNSPWTCWKALTHDECLPVSFELALPLLQWVWRAIPRTSPDHLGDFSPFMPLLNKTRPGAWPAAPWLAWGLTPKHLLEETFAIRVGARLPAAEPDAERAHLEMLLDDLRQLKPPPRGRRAGPGVRGLLAGLHGAAHSKRAKPIFELAMRAATALPGDVRRRSATLVRGVQRRARGGRGRQRSGGPEEGTAACSRTRRAAPRLRPSPGPCVPAACRGRRPSCPRLNPSRGRKHHRSCGSPRGVCW